MQCCAPLRWAVAIEDSPELVPRSRRGRLKLYLGFAAGVGKTYQMLVEARGLAGRGTDVVIGFVEPHGRPETIALVAGLEAVPRRKIEYRGIVIEEMDLEAVLARRPEVVIIDEIPHTNAPDGKNLKRFQDVLDVLAAGIDVIGAMNVQHLESLNDLIERETGVVVRETVPDSFLGHAAQIANVDLPAEDLVERLRAGKIYAPERISWALDNFFKPRNLATLRELALREVTACLERASEDDRRAAGDRSAARGRVMVCLSSFPPHAVKLLRRGSRLAGRLNTDWYVVYVETPAEAPDRIDAEAQRHLLENIDRARGLGAEFVRLKAADPLPALLDFARSQGVKDIIIGSSQQPWWRHALGMSIPIRMVKEAQDLDLHIVSLEEEKNTS